jgi:hypothetical protein
VPTETYPDGYYWLKMPRNRWPEVVQVVNEFEFRRKKLPYVLGGWWKDPLAAVLSHGGRLVGPLEEPVFEEIT